MITPAIGDHKVPGQVERKDVGKRCGVHGPLAVCRAGKAYGKAEFGGDAAEFFRVPVADPDDMRFSETVYFFHSLFIIARASFSVQY